jgi:hypothetical protein
MPSQRFEGLAAAAEAVVKSDRLVLEIPGKPGFFCSSSGNLPKLAVNWRKIPDYTQNPAPEIPNLEPDVSPPLFSLTKPFVLR